MSEHAFSLERELLNLRRDSSIVRRLKSAEKNRLLITVANLLEQRKDEVLAANLTDLSNLTSNYPEHMRDRLVLNDSRIKGMATSLRQVAEQGDPVGEVVESRTLANGLLLKKVRAPIGVILLVFEARPNVITEAFSIALKAGNSIVLRGGSDSAHSAKIIYKILDEALKGCGFTANLFLGVTDYNRDIVHKMLKRTDLIDLVVPRGGQKLIQFVQSEALMPIIKNDRGMCHAYVDQDADLGMAVSIVQNAKMQRPSVCNSLETVLVHESIAHDFLLALQQKTKNSKLVWHVDEKCFQILRNDVPVSQLLLATDEDWDTEHLDYILNCKVVSNTDSAIQHIEIHGSKHSETIITKNESTARHFQNSVDAAVVYWNASTRFTDGFEFGLGGELGISTQKLHVRGPVGIRELTSPRWVIDGTGQIRE